MSMPRQSYTDNERIAYHLKRTKKGAKSKSGKRLSDFMRGKHSGKAEALIAKKRRRARRRAFSRNNA